MAVSACGSTGSGDSSGDEASASKQAKPRESPEYEEVADLAAMKVVKQQYVFGDTLYLDDSLLLIQARPHPKINYLSVVTGIDPTNGKVKWEIDERDLPTSVVESGVFMGRGRLLASDGMAYVPLSSSAGTESYYGFVALDGETGEAKWVARHPVWEPKGTGPDGRSARTVVDIVGAVGDTVVYSAHSYWSDGDLSGLNDPNDRMKPNILHRAETVALDAETGKVRWKKNGFLGRYVTRSHVIGTIPAKQEARRNKPLAAVEAGTGNDAWKTTWKSNVADLSKDWLLVRQSASPDIGPHDGVYEAATGRLVAKLDADTPPLLGAAWVNEMPEAKGHGVAWIVTEQDKDGPQTLYVAKDGESEPRKVAFLPNDRLEIGHPMVTEDDYVMVQSAAIDPIGQQFADLENGELDFPVDATEDDREPITYSDSYLITGGLHVEETILYKRVP
ncbi:PQQ-binding-like beta-propeller repeat protein [Nocardioides sp. YR527]|uniref:PQQ-binding-like beta-propeller repeat protein n=1 Tax=Nocardioides sp. YR527 TaxID=1881028 RepID=UPI0015A02B5E|nr:PQQ-binding-like beta-propeller repeat protein [Nocardioides sp. YR527]